MTEAVGSLRANLSADWADFRSELERSSNALGAFGNNFASVAGNVARLSLTAFAGFSLGKFITDSYQATLAFHQLEGAFGAAFGDNAADARAWADQLAESLHRPQSEILNLADSFQNIFQEISPTSDAAAEASERFTQLALDFAALKNVPVQEALTRIQGGLAGSARGLRQYGIDLSDATVKQAAIRAGIITTNQTLSAQQATLVRASLLQRALTDATGQAAAQSDEAANSQVRLRARLEQTQHALGDALIPAFTAIQGAIAGALDGFNRFFRGLGEALGRNEALVTTLVFISRNLSGQTTSWDDVAAAVHRANAATAQHAAAAPAATHATQAQTAAGNAYADSLLEQARGLHNATTQGHARGKTLEETLALLERERQSLATTTQEREVEQDVLTRVNALQDSYNKNLDGEPARQIRAAVAINANIQRFNTLIDTLNPVQAATREYQLDLAALDTALDRGRITQEQYNAAVATLAFRYRDTLDVQATFIAGQERERQLSALTNQSRSVEEQVIQELDSRQIDYATNKDGPVATAIRNEIIATQNLSRVHEQAQSIYERFVQPTQTYRDALAGITEAAQQYGLTGGETLQLQLEAELQSLQNNTDAASGLRRAMIQLQLDSLDAASRTEQAFNQSLGTVKDTLLDVGTGARDAGEAFRAMILEIIKAQVLKPALDSLFASILHPSGSSVTGGGTGGFNFGGLVGGIGSFLGSLFGGRRAGGGPIVPGMTYEVGEHGKELFTADVPGHITSHEKSSGGRNVTYNVYTPDANSFRASRRQITREERRTLGV